MNTLAHFALVHKAGDIMIGIFYLKTVQDKNY